MDKVYNLIEINMPRKEDDYLVLEFETGENILSLGLYNRHNEEQIRIPEIAYFQNGSVLKLRPLDVGMKMNDEVVLGAEVEDGLAYFKFSKRAMKYLWECYFDYGIADNSFLSTYVYVDLGGKICFINSTKVDVDTNVLRIPYFAVMEVISLSSEEFSFKFSLSFDKRRFSPDSGKIRPVFSLVDHELQSLVPISDFVIEEENGEFEVKGNVELPEDMFSGNYCFAFEAEEEGKVYCLNVYRVGRELFDDIHPYTNDRFVTQNYDCELFWFDREGIIFRINEPSRKQTNIPLFGGYSFDKRLSEKEREKWDRSYQGFEKEWIRRSSFQKF